jgi:hypothetical protein
MKTSAILATAGLIAITPAIAAASQPTQPPTDQGSTQSQNATPPDTSMPNAAPSATKQTDVTCDTTNKGKSDSAKTSNSDQSASANTKPESVKAITRDTGDQAPAPKPKKKSETEMACATQPQ